MQNLLESCIYLLAIMGIIFTTISFLEMFIQKRINNNSYRIFNKNNEYHIMFTEKGRIRSDIVTDEKREVLWSALQIFSINIIMNFALCNREKGKDFRRAIFAKEKEIFSLFGQDFKKRKEKEIEEILKKNPYNDI